MKKSIRYSKTQDIIRELVPDNQEIRHEMYKFIHTTLFNHPEWKNKVSAENLRKIYLTWQMEQIEIEMVDSKLVEGLRNV